MVHIFRQPLLEHIHNVVDLKGAKNSCVKKREVQTWLLFTFTQLATTRSGWECHIVGFEKLQKWSDTTTLL